ncbi:hydrogenase maturation nickel metallochaperone HypA [Winogradskyella vincentii]|uniref:Hydrogenase maturation factor HypA n=1 Tax=Winogradskyella vincentii TaxID=2877122 RepID=A0ABS7Y3T9_9FLAO|nr:hydrogenase maturation nickel metallochaperone HypA [Winogradskyella vincentii]MCA0153358.1 hydrogenase maturation nickel metallochaperone HypA [Winogradskyella vincentii]
MHELSIAMGIVDIAEKETTKANANKVNLIELEIGTLAGIEFEALDFVWSSAVKGTILENAKKKITKVNGSAKCHDCSMVFQLDDLIENCPSCKSYAKTIIQGKELVVKSLEVS